MDNANTVLKSKPLLQFGKFFIVGILNTGIDFAILNLLMLVTGIFKGPYIMIFSTISFTAAVANSYFLNKRWTFQDKTGSDSANKFVKFIAVSVGGLLLNNSIIYFLTTYTNPAFGLSPVLWANFSKIIATVAVLGWNFAGYKLFVFKK